MFAGLFGMVFMPLVAFGQTKDTYGDLFGKSFSAIKEPAVSNVDNGLKQAQNALVSCQQGAASKLGTLKKLGIVTDTAAAAALGLNPIGLASGVKKAFGKFFGGGGGDAQEAQKELLDEICKTQKQEFETLKKQLRDQQKQSALKKWGAVAYKNAITIFFNRLANRMALKVATGITGQKSTIRSSYNLKNELDAVAGDFLDKALKTVWKKSLCEPLTPFAKINITVFTRRFVEPPLPQCTFSKIIKNAGDSLSNITDYQDILDLGGYVSPTGNDLGAILTLTTNLKLEVSQKGQDKRIEQIVGQGFKDLTTPITGLIKTPSSAIREAAYKYIIHDSTSPYLVFTGEAAADAVGIFTNTLAGKLIEHYLFKQGLNPEANLAAGGGVTNIFSLGIQTIQAAAQKFAKLIETPDLRSGDKNITLDLTVKTGDASDPNNCVIDDQFQRAIESDPPMTLKQATEGQTPAINPNRPFGSHALGRGKYDTACEDPNLYSLRSIMILRKYRIVPVGWELAAEFIAERASFDKKDTVFNLTKLMAEYDDPKSPFYKLVDPHWILKAPKISERRKGFGEAQIDEDGESFSRVYSVVDEQTCIKENKDGSCVKYEYCIEEKPTWRIDGTECQAQFNTCQTYSSRTGKSLSLLNNSLDWSSACLAPEAVGCRQYCAYDAALGTFNCAGSTAYSPTNRFGPSIYLNKEAPSCSASAAGCNEYLTLRDKNSGAYLTAAELQPVIASATGGDYTSGNPLSKTDGGFYSSQALVNRIWLKGDVQECDPAYAGCDLFTPTVGREPAIPAIVGNQCLAECVGYRSFKEGYSYFDFGQGNTKAWPDFYPKPANVDFISNTARTCSAAAAGCEEFTDVGDSSQGGERKYYFTYLRQCVQPNPGSTGQAVFYTWEGSDTTGFQLKEWNLAVNTTSVNGAPLGTLCSQAEAQVNADCRQFYNQSAQTFWVLQSTTTLVSDDCKQFRRTKDGSLWLGTLAQAKQCSSGENMCLQYKGTGANNVRIVKLGSSSTGYETFDSTGTCSGSICGWSAQPSQLSPESIVAGGKSLDVSGSVRTTNSLGLKQGAVYELSFWAKTGGSGVGTDAVTADLVTSVGRQSFSLGNDNLLSGDWVYIRGTLNDPGYLTSVPDSDNKTYVEFVGTGKFFIDNITLRETPDSMFLIQNSWKTPATCDATQIGCQSYKNSKGQMVYATEFASLCPLSAVGCVAAVDTKDSTSTLAKTVRGVSTPADSLIYVVDNPKLYCQPQEKGCVRVGMVDTSSDRTPKFTNSYKIVDPDKYEQSVCTLDQEYCEAFTSESGVGTSVFKDPTNFLCEFRTNVSVKSGPQRVSGWYVKGTTTLCPSIPAPQSGVMGRCLGGRSVFDPSGNVCQSNADCTNHSSPGSEGFCVSTGYTDAAITPATTLNFAGSNKPFGALCPNNQSSCFELQDPQNPPGCDPVLLYGESAKTHYVGDPTLSNNVACNYYYYLSESLAPSGCTGQNPEEGCVGFFDTSRPATFSSHRQCLNVNGTVALPVVECRINAECDTGQRCGYP